VKYCFVSVVDENAKGVPDFWLTIFKNVEMLAEMIQVGNAANASVCSNIQYLIFAYI